MIPPDRMAAASSAAHKAYMDVLYGGLLPTAKWSGGPLCQEAPADARHNAWYASQQVPLTAHQPAAAPHSSPPTFSSGPHYGGEPYPGGPPEVQPLYNHKDVAPYSDRILWAQQHFPPAVAEPQSAGPPTEYVAGLGQHALCQQGLNAPIYPASNTKPQAQWPSALTLDQVALRPGQTAGQGFHNAGSQSHLFATPTYSHQSAAQDRCDYKVLSVAVQRLMTSVL